MSSQFLSRLQGLYAQPRDLRSRIRWLFLLYALFIVAHLLLSLALQIEPRWPFRATGAAALVWLSALWIQGCRRGRFSEAGEVFEAFALLAAGLALDDPIKTLELLHPALFFRSLYGSRRRVLARSMLYVVAFLGVVVLGPVLGSRHAPLELEELLFQLPIFPIIAVVMYALSATLERHERALALQETLTTAGGRLVAALDRETIYATALADAHTLLGKVPGTGVFLAIGPADGMAVLGATGDHPEVPAAATINLHALPDPLRNLLLAGRPAAVNGGALGFGERAEHIFMVPLMLQEEFRGAIVVIGHSPPAPERAHALETLGTLVALALQSAALTEELHRRRSEERFRSLVQNSSDVITIIDLDMTIRYQTPSVERIFGYAPAELAGGKFTDLLHAADLSRVLAFAAEAANRMGTAGPIECRLHHRDGAWRHVEIIGTNLLHDPNVNGLVLNTRDITERKTLEEELSRRAFHDTLTGLPNRALLKDRLEHAVAVAERHRTPIAVLFLDLDGFKTINDSLGHAAGDTLIMAVADRLRACVRSGDTVARFGGDEFALLLEGASNQDVAIHAAERIMEATRAPLTIQGKEIFVQGSIGIAVSAPGRVDAEELLRNADVAMYMAKNRGRDRYEVFEPGMHVAVLKRLELEADLRRAIEQQQFFVDYQPLIALKTGRIIGVEALIRWAHPTRGVLGPAEFLPLAEETGLILPIGRWVLHEACRHIRRWQDEYPGDPPLMAAVNLSVRQFQHRGLVAEVAQILRRCRLDPHSLILEITETVVLKDVEEAIKTLQSLKALGVRLAIDDFGTGYSSLSALHRLPVDIIKIDKSFIDALGTESQSVAFTRTILKLGSTLCVQTVAEGVELAEQLKHLQEMGCDLGQGLWFARPMRPEEVAEFLGRERAGNRILAPDRREE